MFLHNKCLMYTVHVDEPDPKFAKLLLEQFGGPNGELAAALRYFTQGWAESDTQRRDMLLDIATEELSHLEMVGQLLVMLLKGSPGTELDEVESGYLGKLLDGERTGFIEMSLNSGQTVLGGPGPRLTDSTGKSFTADWVDTIGHPVADLRSDIAAEARAKIVYERLIKCTNDASAKDSLTFLMQREVAHQKMFESALAAIPNNFPPGNIQIDQFAHEYINESTNGSPKEAEGYDLVSSQKIWDFKLREPRPMGDEPPLPEERPTFASVLSEP